MKKQVLLILFAMCFPWSAWAQVEIDGINYVFDDESETATVVSGDEVYSGVVEIPAVVTNDGKNYTVTSIGDNAFDGCSSMTSVDLPYELDSIGRYAFRGCTSLTYVYIPESVETIGDYAFDGCSNMTSVDLFPYEFHETWGYLSSIGSYAFRGCTSLTSVSIAESVQTIGDYAFDGCDNLVDVYTYYCARDVIPEINSTTFSNRANITLHIDCYLDDFPGYFWEGFGRYSWDSRHGLLYYDNVGYSCYRDFAAMSLEGVDLDYIILDNETCQVGAKIVDRWYAHDHIEYTSNDIGAKGNNMLDFSSRKIKSKAKRSPIYADKANLITIPLEVNGRKVTRIGEEAFGLKYSSNLLAVYIPESVCEIAGGEYYREVEVANDPYGLIDHNEFLNEISELYTYNAGAFWGCDNLKTVVVGMKTPIAIEDNVFSNYSDATLYVPQGCKEAYENAENWNKFGNIVEYDQEQPIDLISLIDVDYHLAEVDGIGYNLFMDGTAEVANALVFKSYIREDWVVNGYVKDTLFKYSGNVIIPETVVYRGHSYKVSAINPHAFRGSKNMTSVTIPSTITSIGKYAFYDCMGLEKVIVPDLSVWCAISFYDRNANPIFRGGHIYSDENTEVKDLVIPEGVESIGNYAFYNCDGITSITLPRSLTRIGSNAFYACDGITSVSIPATITNIGKNAFDGCDSLKSITVGMTVPPTLTAQIASASRIKLYVPKGTKELYEAADYWKDFMEIIEMNETVVITDVSDMDNAFYMDEKSVVPGNRYVLPIKLKNNQLVMGYQFDLELPEGVNFALDDNGMVIATMSERGSSFIISKNKRSERVCRFVVINASNNVLTGEDGVVMNVTVDVADDMEAGAYGVVFKNGELTIKEENAISSINLQNVTALMNVVTALLGDVNNDGRVSVTDVVAIIGFILGNENSNFSSVAADLNGDGSITVVDAVNVINLILNDDSYSKANGLFEMEEE